MVSCYGLLLMSEKVKNSSIFVYKYAKLEL